MQFIRFPFTLYRKDPLWTPPLISEVLWILGDENPFWRHAEKQLFLAMENNTVLGRIAAIIDRNFIEIHKEKSGFFGFFESVNNAQVCESLMESASDWLQMKGMDRMLGPANPSTNDEVGLLIEGFDTPSRIMMPYNPLYYVRLIESCGFRKAKDLLAYFMNVGDGPLERLSSFAASVRRKEPGLIIRSLDRRHFEREVDRVLSVYNQAWEENWGFVPWTEEEFLETAKRLKSLLDPRIALIAEIDARPVGMLLAIPDYNEVTIRLNGKLTPWAILKFLYFKNRIKGIRLMILGVVNQYRRRGVDGLLYYESLNNALKAGYRSCEFSWILEDNVMTCRAAEMMGGKEYKRYRMYQKQL